MINVTTNTSKRDFDKGKVTCNLQDVSIMNIYKLGKGTHVSCIKFRKLQVNNEISWADTELLVTAYKHCYIV